ncbi:MAG: AgmX/PglI C-terminal domain-containing protein [Pseudomonadota bacterium]
MATTIAFHQPQLPWDPLLGELRRFWRILLVLLGIFLLFGLIIPFIELPEPERTQVVELPPRLARIIEEKQAPPPPPPPEPVEQEKVEEEPVPEEEPEEPKVEEKVEEPEPVEPQPETEPVTETAAVEAAREKVKKIGVLALSDSLSDLRDTSSLTTLKQDTLSSGGQTSIVTAKSGSGTATRSVTSTTTSGSGGVGTQNVQKQTTDVQVAARETSQVSSETATKAVQQAAKKEQTKKTTGGLRNEEEIQRTIERNKGAFYRIYNRALRKNPALEGKVVFAITIAKSGAVVEVKVVASDLEDPALEGKLVARIKLIDFGAQDVRDTTVRIPLDFFPA